MVANSILSYGDASARHIPPINVDAPSDSRKSAPLQHNAKNFPENEEKLEDGLGKLQRRLAHIFSYDNGGGLRTVKLWGTYNVSRRVKIYLASGRMIYGLHLQC